MSRESCPAPSLILSPSKDRLPKAKDEIRSHTPKSPRRLCVWRVALALPLWRAGDAGDPRRLVSPVALLPARDGAGCPASPRSLSRQPRRGEVFHSRGRWRRRRSGSVLLLPIPGSSPHFPYGLRLSFLRRSDLLARSHRLCIAEQVRNCPPRNGDAEECKSGGRRSDKYFREAGGG